MARRGEIDWTRIRAEWLAGQLSIRAIAKAHGCSEKAVRKRAEEEQWPSRPPSVVRRPAPKNRKSALSNSADQAADQGPASALIGDPLVVARTELVHPLDRIFELIGHQKRRMARLSGAYELLMDKLGQLLLIVDLEDSPPSDEQPGEAPQPGRQTNPVRTMALLTQVLQALVPIARQLNAEERILFGLDDGVPSFLASMTPQQSERARKLLRELVKRMEEEDHAQAS